MAAPIEDFDTALRQFHRFLAGVGHPHRHLLWIFREDVSTHKRRVLLKVPLPADNERVAQTHYEQGRRLGIGVCLEAFCRLGPALCCTTWFVRDWEESARRLCGGLKLRAPSPSDLVSARPVRGKLLWAARRWLDNHSGFNHFRNFLPARGDTDSEAEPF
jgi:hypothetical protein